MRRWKCVICGYVELAEEPPEICLVCGAGSEAFEDDGPAEEDPPEG